MPTVRMGDMSGNYAQITTSNPRLIAEWLAELLPKFCNPTHPCCNQVRLEMWPWGQEEWPVMRPGGGWTPAEVERIADFFAAIASDRAEAGRD